MTRSPVVLLGLVVTLALADSASAQWLGVKGGVTLSNVHFDPDESSLSPTGEVGYLFGGIVNFRLFGLGMQTEALYSQRRVTFEGFIEDTTTYLEVPLLARVGVFGAGAWRGYVLGGAAFGWLLDAKEEFAGQSEDIKRSFESIEFAASIGGAAEWRGRWVFDFRYIYGLTDIYSGVGAPSARQRAMQITAGYRF